MLSRECDCEEKENDRKQILLFNNGREIHVWKPVEKAPAKRQEIEKDTKREKVHGRGSRIEECPDGVISFT